MTALNSLNEEFDEDFFVPQIESAYRAEAVANVVIAILGNDVKNTEATIEGAYALSEVHRGKYLLHSEYADSFVDGFWLQPISHDGGVRIDLNHNSFVGVSLVDYLRSQFATSCMGCSREEFESSMGSETDIIAAVRD